MAVRSKKRRASLLALQVPCSALTSIGCQVCAGCCSEVAATTVKCGLNTVWSEADASCVIGCDADAELRNEMGDVEVGSGPAQSDPRRLGGIDSPVGWGLPETSQLFGLPAPLNEAVGVGAHSLPHFNRNSRSHVTARQLEQVLTNPTGLFAITRIPKEDHAMCTARAQARVCMWPSPPPTVPPPLSPPPERTSLLTPPLFRRC